MNEIELWESEIEQDIELQDALKEASIYNFYDEGTPVTESMETILEYTQKQLLDPKFLNKMKNNWVKFNSTSAYISTILGIISAGLSAAAGIVVGGPGIIASIAVMPWLGLFVGMNLYDAFTSLSAKIYYKHKDKYEKQFKQLKEKAKKAIENDKKNADKYKNILKQIEKIEKDKAEEAKRLENEAKRANLEYTIDRYRDAIDILKGKFQFEDLDLSGDICGGLYILDKYLKIPEKQTYDKMIKGCKVYTAEEFYGKDEAHSMGFKSDTKLIPLSIDDDAIWVVDIAKKNILCIDYKYRHDSYNLYAFADNYKDDSYDIDEYIEEADKYLGYYKVAECPKAVVPRDLLDDKPVNESVEFIDEGFFDKFKKKKSNNNKVQSKKVEKYNPEEIKVLNKLCDDIIKFSNTKFNSYIKNSKFRKGVLDYMKECDLEEADLPKRLVFEDFDGDIATGYFVMRITDPSTGFVEQDINIALNSIFKAIIEDIKSNPKFNKIADFNIGIGDGDEGCLYMGISLKKEESTNESVYNF